MTRRWLLAGGGAGAALLIGYALWPSHRIARASALVAGSGDRLVSGWIKIGDDDSITVVVPHCDMGTGIYTALAQMAADELDADWSHVRTETAPADPLFANGALAEGFLLAEHDMTRDSIPTFLRGVAASSFGTIASVMHLQITGGSSAIRTTGVYGMRIAGAAAREMLVKAAASRLKAPTDEFRTQLSRVLHAPSGRGFGYGELAASAAQYEPAANPRLKTRNQYTLVGRSIARLDVPAKVDGSLRFGIDVREPGMRHAAIRIAPALGGKLASLDEPALAAAPGVQSVVKLEDAVVVVADTFWNAERALSAHEPVFDAGGHAQVSSVSIRALHQSALEHGPIKADMKTGRGAQALDAGAVFERVYNVPYLAHAAMEPLSATALYRHDGTLEVWAGSQDGLGSRSFCAHTAKLPLKRVTYHLLPSGGAFGRRLPGYWNFLAYAVRTAQAVPGVPVKLLFSREQDMQHDYYRPNVTSRFRATVDAHGMPTVWVNDYTTDEGANDEAHIVYDVAHQSYGSVKVPTSIPTGPWRSVESSWHGFFVESFVDELAHEAGRDPVEYRAALLKDRPRHHAVLMLAAEKAGWGAPLPPRAGRGIAMVESFGTVAAHVIEIAIGDQGAVEVRRVTSAVDCGMAINPDGFRAQIEGGIVFGLGAALYGEITIDQGRVAQQNFFDYPVLRMGECPPIEVHLHESDAPLGGAGEPGVPPVAPALTGAIFAATGIRIRDLPIRKHDLQPIAKDSVPA